MRDTNDISDEIFKKNLVILSDNELLKNTSNFFYFCLIYYFVIIVEAKSIPYSSSMEARPYFAIAKHGTSTMVLLYVYRYRTQ